jgi:hypothetical protein
MGPIESNTTPTEKKHPRLSGDLRRRLMLRLQGSSAGQNVATLNPNVS